jgi:hypothetical protein
MGWCYFRGPREISSERLQTFSGRISQITRFETRLTCTATKILVLQKLSHNAMPDVRRTDSGAVKHESLGP